VFPKSYVYIVKASVTTIQTYHADIFDPGHISGQASATRSLSKIDMKILGDTGAIRVAIEFETQVLMTWHGNHDNTARWTTRVSKAAPGSLFRRQGELEHKVHRARPLQVQSTPTPPARFVANSPKDLSPLSLSVGGGTSFVLRVGELQMQRRCYGNKHREGRDSNTAMMSKTRTQDFNPHCASGNSVLMFLQTFFLTNQKTATNQKTVAMDTASLNNAVDCLKLRENANIKPSAPKTLRGMHSIWIDRFREECFRQKGIANIRLLSVRVRALFVCYEKMNRWHEKVRAFLTSRSRKMSNFEKNIILQTTGGCKGKTRGDEGGTKTTSKRGLVTWWWWNEKETNTKNIVKCRDGRVHKEACPPMPWKKASVLYWNKASRVAG